MKIRTRAIHDSFLYRTEVPERLPEMWTEVGHTVVQTATKIQPFMRGNFVTARSRNGGHDSVMLATLLCALVHTLSLTSKVFANTRRVHVLLPDDYATSGRAYALPQ